MTATVRDPRSDLDYLNGTVYASQAATAKRLTALTKSDIQVYSEFGDSFGNDEASAGHLYSGHLSSDSEADTVHLDDRRPEPLERQLANELRRIARHYQDLADQVDGEMGDEETCTLADPEPDTRFRIGDESNVFRRLSDGRLFVLRDVPMTRREKERTVKAMLIEGATVKAAADQTGLHQAVVVKIRNGLNLSKRPAPAGV